MIFVTCFMNYDTCGMFYELWYLWHVLWIMILVACFMDYDTCCMFYGLWYFNDGIYVSKFHPDYFKNPRIGAFKKILFMILYPLILHERFTSICVADAIDLLGGITIYSVISLTILQLAFSSNPSNIIIV